MTVFQQALIILVLLLAGCAGNGQGLDEQGRPLQDEAPPGQTPPEPAPPDPAEPGESPPTIESIQQDVFTPRCAGCHSGATAPVGLRLEDAETSHAALVGVRAVEDPSLFRVEAGNADDSYLVHKLEGTQSVGNQMPSGQPPLPAETVARIRQWIDLGAAPPAGRKSAAAPAAVVAHWPLEAALLAAGMQRFWVGFDATLDADSAVGAVRIERADGGFERPAGIRADSRGLSLAWLAQPGRYRLRISGEGPNALRTATGRPVDGDGDGVAGGDFLVAFEVRR